MLNSTSFASFLKIKSHRRKSPADVIQGTENFGSHSASALAIAGSSVADAANLEKLIVCALAA